MGVRARQEVFAAVFDPLDRLVQAPGQKRDHHRFRVAAPFDAKTPPNVRRDDPHIALRHTQDVGKNEAGLMGRLG